MIVASDEGSQRNREGENAPFDRRRSFVGEHGVKCGAGHVNHRELIQQLHRICSQVSVQHWFSNEASHISS